MRQKLGSLLTPSNKDKEESDKANALKTKWNIMNRSSDSHLFNSARNERRSMSGKLDVPSNLKNRHLGTTLITDEDNVVFEDPEEYINDKSMEPSK